MLKGIECIKIVETSKASNSDSLDIFYEEYLKDGYEGQMVRLNQGYENKRSKGLLKRKEFIDEEFKILRVVEGVGNRYGTAGYMEFQTKEGRPFKSNIKGDFAYLRSLLVKKDKLVGQMATIKFFAYTPDKVPRFPYVIGIRNYE